MRPLRTTLLVIAVVQLAFGLLFLLAPTSAHTLFGFHPAEPGWTDWLLVMMAGRLLGFAYGTYVASRDPLHHVTWINAMIGVQLVDWISTLVHLHAGDIRVTQVPTAVVLPVLFISALLWFHPRRRRAAAV